MELSRGLLVAVCFLVVLCIDVHECRPERGLRSPRTCEEKGECCPGQNNTCYAFGPRVDRSTDSDRCYCDANCLIMGDCCRDYAHICKGKNPTFFFRFLFLSSNTCTLLKLCLSLIHI